MWDDNINNDSHIYNSTSNSYHYLTPTWENYRIFGDLLIVDNCVSNVKDWIKFSNNILCQSTWICWWC